METLTIDGELVAVATLPDNMKSMVTLYDYTITEEMEARKKLAMIEAARAEIGKRITTAYTEHKDVVAASKEVSTPPE